MKKVLQKYWAWAFVVIPLLLQAIFFYVPMFQGAFYSFTNWTGLTYNYKFVGLNNFKLLFMDPKFMNAIGFTVIITIAMGLPMTLEIPNAAIEPMQIPT